MTRRFAFLAALVLVLPALLGAQAFGPGEVIRPAGGELIKGQYIVVFNDGVRATEQADRVAATFGAEVSRVYQHVLNGAAMKMDDRSAQALARDPMVAYVEQDQVMRVITAGTQTNPPSWGLDRIDQRNLPLDSSYRFDFMGTGVDVYIVDTGIRITHNDFGGRASIGFDAIGDGQNGNDCNGHGTHVSGTAASATYGVAKGANLFAVRVLDCGGSGTNSGVIAGVDFVAANASGPSVANMSLGGGASTALDNAVNNAVNSGVFFAVAAGNENQNAANVSPARAAQAFTVASSTISDARSSFSNFGSTVEIFAPGSSITSTWNTSNSATNTISGTSMASPHVAGAAALILEENAGFSPTQIRNELIARGTSGVISNVAGSPNLLLHTLSSAPPPPPPPSNCPAGSIDFNALTLTSYSNQNVTNGMSVADGGDTLVLTGNTWKRSTSTFTITPDTVIEFEFASSSQGEIHAIGFDNDDTLNNDPRHFQFWGTQNWTGTGKIDLTPKYSGGGAFQSYSVPVGQFYTGSMFIAFTNDKDAGTLNNESRFRCVRVFEDNPPPPPPPPGGCTVDDDFEGGAAGWANSGASSCSTGAYVLTTPTQQSTSGVVTQVGGDHTSGSGNAIFTATNTSAGNADVDRGNCILSSPTWSVTNASTFSVWYFHGQRDTGDDPGDDFFELEISTNGGASFSSVVSIGDVRNTASWTNATAQIPAGSNVQLRLQVSDGSGPGDIVEGGIDDLSICDN